MIGYEEKLLDMSEYKGEQVMVTTNNNRLPIAYIVKVIIAFLVSVHNKCRWTKFFMYLE